MNRYALAFVAVAAILGGTWWHGRVTGYNAASAEQQWAVAVAQAREAELAEELDRRRAERREVVREKIIKVQAVPDPGGCAVTAVPVERAGRMRDLYRNAAAP